MDTPELLIGRAMDAQFKDDLRSRDTALALLSANSAADGPILVALDHARRTAADRGWSPEDLHRHLTRFHSPAHAALLDAASSSHEHTARQDTARPGGRTARPESRTTKPEDHAARSEDHATRSEDHAARSEDHAARPESHATRPEGHTTKPRGHATRSEGHDARPGPRLVGSDRLAAVSMAVDVLCTLQRLPRIAVLTRAATPAHPALDRIRALLAKAESTEYPAEAEALVARAQQLMTRHSLDQAALEAPGDVPTGMRLPVDGPYEEAKATLLHVVAEANRCRAVWQSELGFSTVLGYPADLEAVELLYTSLLLQADAAMPKNGSRKRFRQSFLTSFAHHIGERLARTGEAEITEDLLPVLARRDQAVDTAVERIFPTLKTIRSRRIQDMDGWVKGRDAAKEADLT